MTVFVIIGALALMFQAAAKINLNPLKSFRENAQIGTGAANFAKKEEKGEKR